MSEGRAVGVYVAVACDVLLYGLAAFIAALLTVLVYSAGSAIQGVGPGIAAIPVLVLFGTMTTFVYALPVSALLIGIGEWRGYGRRYYVVAGLTAALASFGLLNWASPVRLFPWLEFASVSVGGLAGGAVFGLLHGALRDRFGPFISPAQ